MTTWLGSLNSGGRKGGFEGLRGVDEGELGGVDVGGLADDGVDLPFVALELDGDAGLLEASGVGFALVAQRIVFGGDDEGGREAAEVDGAQRRGERVEAVFFVWYVLVPVPGHPIAT